MSDTAYPPNAASISANLGSATVALQIVQQELTALQAQNAGVSTVPGGAATPLATTTPAQASSTGTAGSSTSAARADHAHPTDTSRAGASDLTALASSTGMKFSALNTSALAAPLFGSNSLTFTHLDGSPVGTFTPSGGGTVTAPASAALFASDATGKLIPTTLAASTSGTLTTLTNTQGQQVAQFSQVPGPPGAAGTLGNGDLSANMFATLFGGKARLLADFLGNIRTSYHFGTQNSGTTVQSLMGFNSRSDMYNYMNGQGNRPFAFMQDYPVSTGDDICVFVPPGNTTSTTTVHLTQTYTLPGAESGYGGPVGLYTGVEGYSWLYMGTSRDLSRTFTYGQPISDTGGKLASGSVVFATQDNCIRISLQPSGTALAPGAVITVGTVPTASMVGKQCFAPQGLKAPRNRANKFPTITAANPAAGTITLSSALYVSSTSNGNGGYTDGNTYGQQITGLQPLSVLYIFTPLAESAITSTMTMDDLAANAVVFNSRTGDQSHDVAYVSTGDHIQAVPWYWWDVSCSVFGAHSQATYIRTACSSYAVISYFPKMTAIGKISGLSIYTLNGNASQHAGLYIEGAGETQPILNNLQDIKISFEVTDINTAGPVQGVRLRHIGGEWLDDLTHVGKDLTTLNPSATLVTQNVVYARVGRLGAQNCGAAWLVEGYMEHLIIENSGDVSCASFFDNDLVSVVNGVGCLIGEVKGTDMDVQFFGARFAHFQSLSFIGQEVQFPNNPRAMLPGRNTAPILSVEGSDAGQMAHVFGGAANGGNTDLIQVKARNLNGGTKGTSGFSFSHLNENGFPFAATLRIDAGCNGNRIYDDTIVGTVVDNGSNTHISGGGSTVDYQRQVFLEAGIPSGTVFNGTPGIVAFDTVTDPNGNLGTDYFWTAPITCWVRMEATAFLLNTGDSGAPPAGTLVGISWQPNAAGADYDDFTTTTNGATTLRFTRLLLVGKGSRWCLSPYAGGGATAAKGTGLQESRASITFVRLPT